MQKPKEILVLENGFNINLTELEIENIIDCGN